MIRRYPFVFLLVLTLSIVSCSREEVLPNILIILVDDMGYGDAGCYNAQSKIPTPNIDRLAENGMRFTDAHAAGPLCHPSRYGLLTGRYPFRTDISVWPNHPTIEEGRLTLPLMLKMQGYHTAMVGKWHLGFEEKGYDKVLAGGPVDRGFDSFIGLRASTDIPPYFYIRDDMAISPPTDSIAASFSEGWSPIQGAFWREGLIAPDLQLEDVLPRFTSEAIDIIASHSGKNKEKPLMLYLAYPSPHTPWLPEEQYIGKSDAGMYGDFMNMVDDHIGKLLAALEGEGMEENTLVIFSSDNGPVWYDEDVDRFEHDASGGLNGMKGDAFEAGHRVPFIVKWPGKVDRGTMSEQLLCFTDVFSTLSELVGMDVSGGDATDSYSFLDVLLGNGQERERPPVVMQSANGAMMIRSGDWKLINQLGSGGFTRPGKIEPQEGDPKGQLYNLRDDLAETNNLYFEHPEIVSRLLMEMENLVDQDAQAIP